MYLIMKRRHPGFIVHDARPHLIVSTREEAKAICNRLNKTKYMDYWVVKVKVHGA